MRERFRVYLKETMPVLDFFVRRDYRIVEVNGEQSIEAVHNDIVRALHETHHADHAKTLNEAS
jgi:adenylate kinase family enzyme